MSEREIRSFAQMVARLAARSSRSRLAVVWPSDSCTRAAVARAVREGFAAALMVGCRREVEADPAFDGISASVTLVDAGNPDEAARKAVALVRGGEADVLMKGMINTDNLLRAILDKEQGLLPKGDVLTHLAAAEVGGRMLLFSDAAVIPFPDGRQRRAQVGYLAGKARSMGIEKPRVALIHCSEKVQEKHFPYTADYRLISAEAADGTFGPCLVDGPMDLMTACSPEGMAKKGLHSPVGGKADCLVFPDIESGNVFYKTLPLFCHAIIGGMLCGTQKPVVLTSRGDTEDSKFYSLALACL